MNSKLQTAYTRRHKTSSFVTPYTQKYVTRVHNFFQCHNIHESNDLLQQNLVAAEVVPSQRSAALIILLFSHCMKAAYLQITYNTLENCTLLGYYAALNGNPLLTFWDTVSVPSKRLFDP
jgi:hypothetical protein